MKGISNEEIRNAFFANLGSDIYGFLANDVPVAAEAVLRVGKAVLWAAAAYAAVKLLKEGPQGFGPQRQSH